MTEIVIKAENIGKKYVIGHHAERGRYTALRDVLMQNARTLWNKTKDLATGKPIVQGDTMEEVWALKNVNFEIRRGEAVGIIGRNGAGKSTLLKILSRITEPSTGRVAIKGRVASLLEVGTGFHPELSGRENIYLNGTILGMTRAEIKQKFDEIVAFAEVEKYLDTPVKRYSSGMYVRLAFAVAAHLEPEILVVDEVLAVGDAEFQKKCLGKMGDVARKGRTVLLVSHNMAAVRKLCSHSLLLDKGAVLMADKTDTVIDHYLNVHASLNNTIVNLPKQNSLSNEKGMGLRLSINDESGNLRSEFKIGEKWVIHLEFEIHKYLKHVIAGIGLSNRESIPLITYWSQHADLDPGCYFVDFVCDLPLKATQISISVGLSEQERAFYYVQDVGSIEVLQVSNAEQPFRTVGAGLLLGNQNSLIHSIND